MPRTPTAPALDQTDDAVVRAATAAPRVTVSGIRPDDEELTDDEAEEILTNEADILRGLLALSTEIDEQVMTLRVPVVIEGKRKILPLHFHGITEETNEQCREESTRFEMRGKVRIPMETDTSKYRCLVIYHAATDEDRKAYWDNKTLWKRLDCLQGWEVIQKVIRKPAHRDQIMGYVNQLSGYGEDADIITQAKNS